MVNLPLGELVAFRVAAKYGYQPGWINVFGPEVRTSNTLYGVPVLADPADSASPTPTPS